MRRAAGTVAIVVLVAAAAACSGDSDGGGGGGAAAETAVANTDSGHGAVDPAQVRVEQPGQHVISIAELAIDVEDAEDATARATSIARDAGGFLFSQEASLEDDVTVVAVYKVPPERFDPVVDALAQLGDVQQRTVDTDDVTGQAVDLDARVANARKSVERLREMLTSSGTVGDLLAVEQAVPPRPRRGGGDLVVVRTPADRPDRVTALECDRRHTTRHTVATLASSSRRGRVPSRKHASPIMVTMHDEHFAELFSNRTQLAVARTLPIPFAAAIAGAVGLTRPAFPIDRRWRRDENGPLDRTDLAPARARGHLDVGRRAVRVEIELAPWADGTSELVIRPDVRAPQRWSGRRRQTWYASAHRAADALRQQLLDAQPHGSRKPARFGSTLRAGRLAG